MIDLSHHIIFIKDSDFLVDQSLQYLYSKGLDSKCLYKKEPKEPDVSFREKVYTLPMFGPFAVGIIKWDKEYDNADFDVWIDTVPEHAYIFFRMEKLPGRITQKVKNNVTFRDSLSEAENTEVLQNFLTILGKKVSINARKFLLNRMQEDPAKVITILSKLASYTPHLFIDEDTIKKSFEETLDAFEGPMAFWKSKGLEAARILNKLDFPAFRTLFSRFLLVLIQFKIAEGKSVGEKMRILHAHPDVIRQYEDIVKPHTLKSLENKFLYYTEALSHGKDIFLIKHLTYKP